MRNTLKAGVVLSAILCSTQAFATNGLMPLGIGAYGKSLGGNETIILDDAYTGANNPAASVFGKKQFDVELELEYNTPSVQRTASPVISSEINSDKTFFPIPSMSYTNGLSGDMAWGISFYGIGGTSVKYPGYPVTCPGYGISNIFCGPQSSGAMEAAAELKQLVLAPNLAYKINEQHSIGVSLLLVHQSIEAAGLEGFTSYSVDATHLTGKGPDTSMGYGLKLGWIGLLSDNFRLGATYQMKTDMSVFENYKGLLAEGGNADIPAVFALGGAYKMENSEFLFEIKQIMNSGVASLSNPNTISSAATFLGTNQGAGFGFKDQTVFKLGYILKREQEHRFGINYGKSVVEKENVGFAFLAPAVGELHLSYGSSLAMGEGSKLNYTLWYLMPNTVEGDTQVGVTPSKGKVSLNQVALAVAYTWDLN